MSPAPRRRRLQRAGCCALRPRRERPCGTPQRPRGARRIVRRRPAAAWQIADARALAAAPALPARRRIEPRRLETGTPELVLATSDSWFASSSGPEPGHTGQRSPRAKAPAARPFSFIRTVTVGFGIAPNLLTPPPRERRRSRARAAFPIRRPYRRWGISPRPENRPSDMDGR